MAGDLSSLGFEEANFVSEKTIGLGGDLFVGVSSFNGKTWVNFRYVCAERFIICYILYV